jgi:predicted glycoside hydrolase/deacetylase ChbG (UPF0249 family)
MIPDRVIINADDLGISQEVNDAIFDLMAKRRISSATVMANAPALRHAISGIGRFPHCSFGVHLNLTQFAPLHSPAAALLTGADGMMSRTLSERSFDLKRLSAMYHELSAQVELLGSLGLKLSHFDSHHHVHTKPQILPVLKALQRRFKMRKVRISKNIYTSDQPVSPALARRKTIYNGALRKLYATRTTDGFTELLSFRAEWDRKALPSYKSVELMVHPGAAYAAGETAVLESDWLAASGLDSRLISYHDL